MNRFLQAVTAVFVLSAATYRTAHAQPTEWQWTPTNASGVMLGQVTINGAPAEAADWIGAFDPAGNCAGAAPIIVNGGLAYFNLPVYGDDTSTPNIDEGITAGEPFTLRIWQAVSNSFATYPNDDAPEYLEGWSNTNGAPIPDYSDPSVVYAFALQVNIYILCPESTCMDGLVQTLEWGPPGGVAYGPGLSGVYWDPLEAGVGVHELSYVLGDTAVTCTVEVTATPDATIVPIEPVCANSGAFMLEAATAGGVWSGEGVLGAFFDPAIAGVGNHQVSYAVGEGLGCTDLSSINVVVYPAPFPPNIGPTANGNGLQVENPGADPLTWQWHYADGTPVDGATSTTFGNPQDGVQYYVTATNNYGCSANSATVTFIAPGVMQVGFAAWQVGWNPVSRCLESNAEILQCELYSLTGKCISTSINPCGLKLEERAGEYVIVRVRSVHGSKAVKIQLRS